MRDLAHRDPRRGQRGSIFVELIFFLPVVILIWVLLNFIYDTKHTAVVTQKSARECAWHYALSGCQGTLPAHCQGGNTRLLNDAAIRVASGGAFSSIMGDVKVTAPNLANIHGRSFNVEAEEPVQRPAILGGTTIAVGRFATMCADPPPIKWTTTMIFVAVCNSLGESMWCP